MDAVVFGGSGAIGAAVVTRLRSAGCEVVGTARTARGELRGVDPFGEAGVDQLNGSGPFDVAIWAQGTNCNDTIADADLDRHVEVLQANLLFVTRTLQHLLTRDALRAGARLCVISSIWENVVRPNKFSYTVSKAALGGFVRSAAVDLAPRGIFVNAVLPGVVDTPMTRDVLTDEQIGRFEEATGFGRLVGADDVANAVYFLVSAANTGITGQSIPVDLGYSNVHVL